jgi:hypothetical protein
VPVVVVPGTIVPIVIVPLLVVALLVVAFGMKNLIMVDAVLVVTVRIVEVTVVLPVRCVLVAGQGGLIGSVDVVLVNDVVNLRRGGIRLVGGVLVDDGVRPGGGVLVRLILEDILDGRRGRGSGRKRLLFSTRNRGRSCSGRWL